MVDLRPRRRHVAAALAGLAAVTSGTAAATPTTSHPPVCRDQQLRLAGSFMVSPETGEQGRDFVLLNRSMQTCELVGYPGVSLFDRRERALPFRFVRGGQYIPRWMLLRRVVLRPGARAYFRVAKYRCDAGNRAFAVQIRVYPPDGRRQLRAPTTAFSYCRGDYINHIPDRRDPGNLVHVGPVQRLSVTAGPPDNL